MKIKQAIRKFKQPNRLVLTGVFFVVTLVGVNSINSAPTHAAPVVGFNAGRIIDDSVFTNANSMDAGQIQAFLNSKVPTCETWHAAGYGQNPPFICLKDYNENGRSAAQIIYDTAQQYQINPQVLIVLLQKEQGLVTDTWPLNTQYRTATGYGCPDTAPCDSQYYGLTNQLKWSGTMFRAIMNNSSSWYTPYILGNNTVYFNPGPYDNANNRYFGRFGDRRDIEYCGSTTVNIQNRATQALYNYTPYQPNQASLDAGYGSAGTCGAYGNRNFYQYFKDWFGNTYGIDYSANYSSQSAYPTVYQGQDASVSLSYVNNGNKPWYDSASAGAAGQPPVVLATMMPINRCSDFRATTWYDCNRPTGLFSKVYESNGVTLAANQHVVQSGQIARYDFTMSVPGDFYLGTFKEFFGPIREGAPGYTWYMGADYVSMNITVLPAYSGSYVSQSNYPTIQQNDKANIYVRFKNTGLYPWFDTTSVPTGQHPTTLATDWSINRISKFSSGWPYEVRPATVFSHVYEADGSTLSSNQHTVQPGQVAEYSFPFTAKLDTSPGTYREYFSFIREGARNWRIENATAYWDVTVKQSNVTAAYSSQSAYPTITKGSSTPAHFIFKNSGNVAWYDDTSATSGIAPIHLSTYDPVNRLSAFADSTWPNGNRPNYQFSQVYESDGQTLASNQHIVQPGQLARYSFTLKASSSQQSGIYRESFMPIVEGAPGYGWNTGIATWLQVTIP
ncbi:MAG: hypothetical protein JWM00_164 [Candidatus Saccharibacteria bacterium]|nr:hypothetical protein [Candidatus Saccharibacteria bacterium]